MIKCENLLANFIICEGGCGCHYVENGLRRSGTTRHYVENGLRRSGTTRRSVENGI